MIRLNGFGKGSISRLDGVKHREQSKPYQTARVANSSRDSLLVV